MSRTDRLLALCERGSDLLAEGDLDGAARQLEQARKIDARHVDVLRLDASVAAAEGDVERALDALEALAERLPEEAMPWISAAQVLLYSADDPEGALEKIDVALEKVDDEDDLIDAVLVRADALLALARPEEAREALAELATSAIAEAPVQLAIGELHLAAEDPAGALRWAERATADAEFGTDALHLVGCAHELLGDEAARTRCWREVRARDAAEPRPPWHLDAEAFEAIAARALEELPARAKELLRDVPILIDDLPAEGVVDDGMDPRALGLIDGPNLVEQAVEGGRSGRPVNIFLYQKNLERAFDDPEELAEQIRVTVLHETAHYFGLDEDEVAAMGLE